MWNAVSSERSLGLAAMPDTPGSRIVGPKARRSSVEWSVHPSSGHLARPFRTLNPECEARAMHARRELSSCFFCGGTVRSARPHTVVAGVRVGRSAAASNKCLVYERELATLLARRQQHSDCLSFPVPSHSLRGVSASVKRAAAVCHTSLL